MKLYTRTQAYNVDHSDRNVIFCCFEIIKWYFRQIVRNPYDVEQKNGDYLLSHNSAACPLRDITLLACALSLQFDMQQMSLEELKQVLFHAFRDHLTMKDIENIIVNEEESLKDSSGNCQTEFEGGEW